MTAFYIVLKVAALLAVIILPLTGPKKKKTDSPRDLGKLAVNENGLNYISEVRVDPHPVN